MDLTVNEAAIALEKSPRAVRYMIARGQLKAVRRGRVWLIKRTDLPLDDAQASRARRRSNRIRRVVESALGDALPDAPSASDSRRKPKGERKERKPITVRDLRLYHLALELHESVVKLELPSDGGVRQPAPEVAFLEGIRALCVGYYHYDRRLKCDAYVRARF